MKPDYHIVIPARMESQRLPGKPLLDIGGRSLIEHVWRRAGQAGAQSVVIATDSTDIFHAAQEFGADAVMTSREHQSGSDRIAECADLLDWGDDTLLVNLQGDEPLMPAACLNQAAGLLQQEPEAEVASLYWPIESSEEVNDPNAVKVVTGEDGFALYFSRSAIPYPRGYDGISGALSAGIAWYRHIGLYAYRVGALRAFSAMRPAYLESVEKLEQLRFLESGRRIVMAQAVEEIPAGVDTLEDLRRVRDIIAAL